MTLYDNIHQKLKQKLATSPSDEDLRTFLNTVLHQESPTEAFHQANLSQIKEPTLLFTRLMVQDMRQSCYFYPFIIEKPFSASSKTYFFKYGHKEENFEGSLLENQAYFHELEDRELVACVPVVGETEWARGVQKNDLTLGKPFEMIVDKMGVFKLGEIFDAVCVFQPEENLLYFVRRASSEETKKWINIDEYLSKEIQPESVRDKLLSLFNKFSEERYSHFLLYTLLSTEHFFISATRNDSDLFRKLLPKVCEVKVQAPFKESFFPYKDEQQVMVQTQMQLSQSHTFVIIDFSNFSTQNEIKIGPEEIDNLKALKIFVEEGSTIYRWLYGESLLKHEHTGMVVRASSIINPQYVIPEKESQKQQKQQKQLQEIEESDLPEFRSYIQQMRKINPLLGDDRKQIEEKITTDTTGKFNQISLVKVMELSKLNARSAGRSEIKMEDFVNSCKLYF